MRNTKIDIYKMLLINRMVVFGLTIAFIVSSVIFAVSLKSLYTQQLNTVLVMDYNGEVIPMKWMQRDDNIKVEIKDHLDRFLTYFYQYDAFNVNKSIERALWFGDKSVEQIYIKRKNDNYYSQVATNGINQTIELIDESIEIVGRTEPFAFRAKAILSMTQEEQTVRYSFEVSGLIIFVNRSYPLNPHGMLITKYAETNKEKI